MEQHAAKNDIHERIYRFVLRVIRFLHKLPKTQINLIMINQCMRSVTSVGANDQEADACVSRRDFIAKYGIARKELKETNYWTRIIGDINPGVEAVELEEIREEGREILLIVSTIIKNTKKRD